MINCFLIFPIDLGWFHFNHMLFFPSSHPIDDYGIVDDGAKYKENTSQDPRDNGRNMMGIPGSVTDDIIEYVDQNKSCGDKETNSGRVRGRGDEKTDPGDDDEDGGREVIH